eukprot:symbB.v1.2.016230.t1/scaffold1230.1/size216073/10
MRVCAESFQASSTFQGARPGFAFKLGPMGLGYYQERVPLARGDGSWEALLEAPPLGEIGSTWVGPFASRPVGFEPTRPETDVKAPPPQETKTKPPLQFDTGLRETGQMLKSALLLVFPAFALSPEPPSTPTAAQGEALFQSSVRVYGRKSLADQGFDLRLNDMASDDLLSESSEAPREGIEQEFQAAKPKEEKLEGLALLYADLIWIWGLLRHTATSLFMDICTSLREFRADFLAWLTALVSFGLTRALLLPMLSTAKKIVDDTHDEPQEDEVPGKSDIKMLPQERQGMEIKLDVSNPVMIQRAREQIEDAEKRAESMKSAQPGHRDVFGCTSLHLAAHNCHKEDVAELLNRGFSANVQDSRHLEIVGFDIHEFRST